MKSYEMIKNHQYFFCRKRKRWRGSRAVCHLTLLSLLSSKIRGGHHANTLMTHSWKQKHCGNVTLSFLHTSPAPVLPKSCLHDWGNTAVNHPFRHAHSNGDYAKGVNILSRAAKEVEPQALIKINNSLYKNKVTLFTWTPQKYSTRLITLANTSQTGNWTST